MRKCEIIPHGVRPRVFKTITVVVNSRGSPASARTHLHFTHSGLLVVRDPRCDPARQRNAHWHCQQARKSDAGTAVRLSLAHDSAEQIMVLVLASLSWIISMAAKCPAAAQGPILPPEKAV